MGVFIETGTGKTRYFNNVLDYLDYTEDGWQKITADNIGKTIDPGKTSSVALESNDDDIEIEGLPEMPNEEYEGK